MQSGESASNPSSRSMDLTDDLASSDRGDSKPTSNHQSLPRRSARFKFGNPKNHSEQQTKIKAQDQKSALEVGSLAKKYSLLAATLPDMVAQPKLSANEAKLLLHKKQLSRSISLLQLEDLKKIADRIGFNHGEMDGERLSIELLKLIDHLDDIKLSIIEKELESIETFYLHVRSLLRHQIVIQDYLEKLSQNEIIAIVNSLEIKNHPETARNILIKDILIKFFIEELSHFVNNENDILQFIKLLSVDQIKKIINLFSLKNDKFYFDRVTRQNKSTTISVEDIAQLLAQKLSERSSQTGAQTALIQQLLRQVLKNIQYVRSFQGWEITNELLLSLKTDFFMNATLEDLFKLIQLTPYEEIHRNMYVNTKLAITHADIDNTIKGTLIESLQRYVARNIKKILAEEFKKDRLNDAILEIWLVKRINHLRKPTQLLNSANDEQKADDSGKNVSSSQNNRSKRKSRDENNSASSNKRPRVEPFIFHGLSQEPSDIPDVDMGDVSLLQNFLDSLTNLPSAESTVKMKPK